MSQAIGDVRRALIRGNATAELTALWSLLWGWGEDDKQLKKDLQILEIDMIRAGLTPNWPRPKRSAWQPRYFSALVNLARRHELLDITMRFDLDEDVEIDLEE